MKKVTAVLLTAIQLASAGNLYSNDNEFQITQNGPESVLIRSLNGDSINLSNTKDQSEVQNSLETIIESEKPLIEDFTIIPNKTPGFQEERYESLPYFFESNIDIFGFQWGFVRSGLIKLNNQMYAGFTLQTKREGTTEYDNLNRYLMFFADKEGNVKYYSNDILVQESIKKINDNNSLGNALEHALKEELRQLDDKSYIRDYSTANEIYQPTSIEDLIVATELNDKGIPRYIRIEEKYLNRVLEFERLGSYSLTAEKYGYERYNFETYKVIFRSDDGTEYDNLDAHIYYIDPATQRVEFFLSVPHGSNKYDTNPVKIIKGTPVAYLVEEAYQAAVAKNISTIDTQDKE